MSKGKQHFAALDESSIFKPLLFSSSICSEIGRASLVYDLNVLIKSKRPALVRCSNGKRGGFCCYKVMNNHWIIQTFKQKNTKKLLVGKKSRCNIFAAAAIGLLSVPFGVFV